MLFDFGSHTRLFCFHFPHNQSFCFRPTTKYDLFSADIKKWFVFGWQSKIICFRLTEQNNLFSGDTRTMFLILKMTQDTLMSYNLGTGSTRAHAVYTPRGGGTRRRRDIKLILVAPKYLVYKPINCQFSLQELSDKRTLLKNYRRLWQSPQI